MIISYFIIKLHIYPFDVMVSVNESDETLLKRLIKYDNTEEECEQLMNMSDTSRGRAYMLPSNQTVIRLKLQLDKYDMIGTITHESFHAATYILNRIGVKFKLFISDEIYSYLIEFLTKEICKKLKI